MSFISNKLASIKPSPTLSVNKIAAELKARGVDIISLSVGELEEDTPQNIKDAAIEAINSGFTKYTNVDGMPQLKEAVKAKFQRENNLTYDINEIIIGNGGKQILYNVFMASLNEGDEVIIPAPYWVSYPDIVLLAGGVPKFIECSLQDDFKLTPQSLKNNITSRTKWVIINSPSNPTGSAYSKDELLQLAEVFHAYPYINILTDDIYEHILFDNFQFTTLAEVAPELKNRIFIVNGVSKSYSMTGWRIGYGAGDEKLIKAMTMVQSQCTSNPCSISQVAAIEALNGPQDFLQLVTKNFHEKRDIALSSLREMSQLQCYKPQGAFYLFPKCNNLYGRKSPSGDQINNSTDLAKYFLNSAKVAVVPGIAFGMDDYFRISFASSKEVIKEACNRIVTACKELA